MNSLVDKEVELLIQVVHHKEENCQQLMLIQSTMNSLVDKEDELSTVATVDSSTMNSLVDKADELSTVATVDSKYYEFISGQG